MSESEGEKIALVSVEDNQLRNKVTAGNESRRVKRERPLGQHPNCLIAQLSKKISLTTPLTITFNFWTTGMSDNWVSENCANSEMFCSRNIRDDFSCIFVNV